MYKNILKRIYVYYCIAGLFGGGLYSVHVFGELAFFYTTKIKSAKIIGMIC